MDIEFSRLMEATGGRLMGTQPSGRASGVSTDSRTLKRGDIFFALRGPHFDGHRFVHQAIQKNAWAVVLSEREALSAPERGACPVVLVEDSLRAYGDLAGSHRRRFKIPVVAITGSCGKTTVKELTAHLLGARWKVLKNEGTENNLVGVPKTLLGLETHHQAAVLELGTSFPGEIRRLAEWVSPRIGVLTQIGASHLQGLSDFEGVLREKLSLVPCVAPSGAVVVNGEDPFLKEFPSHGREIRRVCAKDARFGIEGTTFFAEGGVEFRTPLLGRHNVINCLLAMEVAGRLGISRADTASRLKSFQPVSGRLKVRAIEEIIFLDDSYNANPTSFGAALAALQTLAAAGKRTGVVCGDMLELGPEAENFHREAGEKIAGAKIDFLIATGTLSKNTVQGAIAAGLPTERVEWVPDSVSAADACRRWAGAGDRVLVKGSRGMHMEKVIECFITSSTR